MLPAPVSASCPCCQTPSSSVYQHLTRKLQHYALMEMRTIEIKGIRYRCKNLSCSKKSFLVYYPEEDFGALTPRSRYTSNSKFYVARKMLSRDVSYLSLYSQIKEDFGGKTSLSTIHTWTQQVKLEETQQDMSEVVVLHTDEKHPSKKKKK